MDEVNRHSILVYSRMPEALAEVIRWGEASWWPKRSLMRFARLGQGPVQKGTRYRQKVLLPFAPSWDVEVEEVTGEGITRRFLNGMFCGKESVSLGQNGAALDVVYVMNYRINGAFNRFLWRLVFRRLHDASIEAILANLKQYLERQ